MLKERQVLPVSSTRKRASPYPLRSCRSKKQKEAESSPPLVPESSVSEWEDVRCAICLEPPHNAVLLQCSSSSKGCRAYMCDTSSRHSNCFKQYSNNNKNNRSKTLKCPYCRGEVHGTMKSTPARRFMNARPRCCSVDGCHFSGTYSQLKTHLKAEHPGFISPMLSRLEQLRRDREAEYIDTLNALRRWEVEETPPLLDRPLYQFPPHYNQNPLSHLTFDAFINPFNGTRRQASAVDYPHGTMYPRWYP
ncbi:hypothetical protein Rs2_36406 [Raphanus sativus]|uniref:Uncharacterized protein LOC108822978 n=1 Tax=Raphanus sativus TaxID=3726 RepID=A0A6J0KUV7_RAPSA|nr:uncharacterized protein LOC108822978 [Raphanus sativus]KAJ4879352.1 hypothetical protein Rs2_36406 [Raphanus sativus]